MACHHVAEGDHLERVDREDVGKQLSRRCFGEAPVVAIEALFVIDPYHAGCRSQQHAARLEDASALAKHRGHVVDQMERLGEDDAVVRPARNRIGATQVGDHGGEAVARIDIDDVAGCDGVAAKPARVNRIPYFENAAANVRTMRLEKRLDVVSIDRRSAIAPPLVAERPKPPEIAPFHSRHPLAASRRNRRRRFPAGRLRVSLVGPPVRASSVRVYSRWLHEECLFRLDQLQSVTFDGGTMLRVEVSKPGQICVRLDGPSVAGAGPHAVVEERLVPE